MEVAVIIPAYQPDERLIQLVHSLIALKAVPIVVVNDGSSADCAGVFGALEGLDGCRVLHHEYNKGKGAALKTAFREMIKSYPSVCGAVTADADGQHTPEDVLKMTEVFQARPDRLLLGARDFTGGNVPRKSRFGNHMTRYIFRLSSGVNLSDTQTGLRAIPAGCFDALSTLPGDRYEYEMNMLVYAVKNKIPMLELPIKTVYIDGNKGSHFKPVADAVRIYGEIIKFAFSSVLAAGIDIGLFTVVAYLLSASKYKVLAATVTARVCSSLINFMFNKNVVFKSNGRLMRQAAKYYGLAAVQMLVSWGAVQGLTLLLPRYLVLLKIAVDTVLFLISHSVQKKLVFGKDSDDQV